MALRDEASIEDADAAIRLLRESLRQVGIDPETGRMDIDVVMVGTSTSTRSKIETLMDMIKDMEEKTNGKAVSIEDIIERAQELNLTRDFVERNIERMRQDGLLFQPKAGYIKRT
jgi:replicative DNA helicase Mcm